MDTPLPRRIGQALGLASCPLSYLTTTLIWGALAAPRIRFGLIGLSVAWSALELFLGIARPAQRTVSNAPWVKVTRGVWLTGPWVAWLDFGHGWTHVNVPERLQWAMLLVGALGLAVRFAAVIQLGSAFTYDHSVGDARALKRDGVYRLVRHPAYLGLLTLTNLLGFVLGSGLGALLLASTIPNVMQRIRDEEADLIRVHGDAYRAYQARSARMIPFVY